MAIKLEDTGQRRFPNPGEFYLFKGTLRQGQDSDRYSRPPYEYIILRHDPDLRTNEQLREDIMLKAASMLKEMGWNASYEHPGFVCVRFGSMAETANFGPGDEKNFKGNWDGPEGFQYEDIDFSVPYQTTPECFAAEVYAFLREFFKGSPSRMPEILHLDPEPKVTANVVLTPTEPQKGALERAIEITLEDSDNHVWKFKRNKQHQYDWQTRCYLMAQLGSVCEQLGNQTLAEDCKEMAVQLSKIDAEVSDVPF